MGHEQHDTTDSDDTSSSGRSETLLALAGPGRAAPAVATDADRARVRRVLTHPGAAEGAESAGRRVVLDRRSVPRLRQPIEHLLVSPTGVWVIRVLRAGRVERRDVGGFFRTEERLFVDGRDRTADVDALTWQRSEVAGVLGSEQAAATVRSALVCVDPESDVPPVSFDVDDVLVVAVSHLAREIDGDHVLTDADVDRVAGMLSNALLVDDVIDLRPEADTSVADPSPRSESPVGSGRSARPFGSFGYDDSSALQVQQLLG